MNDDPFNIVMKDKRNSCTLLEGRGVTHTTLWQAGQASGAKSLIAPPSMVDAITTQVVEQIRATLLTDFLALIFGLDLMALERLMAQSPGNMGCIPSVRIKKQVMMRMELKMRMHVITSILVRMKTTTCRRSMNMIYASIL